mmetsp:Transcript_80078/g.259411  ORF Transcript_80078/g.259411 Transcript_80078/m.259411 type:complete len:319 (+) Transcript_80078:3-959(+)
MDVFNVQNISDIGTGEPLFANFTWEDWMLLSLRFELHLLVHAYKHDVNDPERTSFHETHLTYYYGKYFKKQFNLKYYGVETELELLEIIKDTIEVAPKNSVLDPQLADDTPMENFVKLTEDHRRERQRRIDAGDETAALKFQKPPPRQQSNPQGYMQQGSRGGYQSRGPPPPSHTRAAMPPSSRMGPLPGASTRYGSSAGTRGGSGAYGSGSGSGSGSGGYGSRGAPPGRYPAPAPPPSRSYGHPPASSYGGGNGGQKRSYPPLPSSGGSSGPYPPYKQGRSSSYGSGPPPSRGSYGSGSGSSYGGGSGGGYSSSYRR